VKRDKGKDREIDGALGLGAEGERVSLYFFCFVVTKLQKAGNPYQYRLSP
jgi:hypothetical protein